MNQTKQFKQCPYCGGEIMLAAKKCKHCGEWLEEQDVCFQGSRPTIHTSQKSDENVSNTVVDIFIQGIRKISLRTWLLISICAVVLSEQLAKKGETGKDALMISMILSSIGGIIFICSLIAHLVNDKQRIKHMIMLVVIGQIVGICGIANAFSIVPSGTMEMLRMSNSPQAMQEFNLYILTKCTVFSIIQNSLYIIAMVLGISSLNRKYLIPWVILLVGYFAGLIAQLQDKDSFEFMTFSLVSSVLSFVAIIWFLWVGNKLQTNSDDNK